MPAQQYALPEGPSAESLALIREVEELCENVPRSALQIAENQCRACGRLLEDSEPTFNGGACDNCAGCEGYGLSLQGHRANAERIRGIASAYAP